MTLSSSQLAFAPVDPDVFGVAIWTGPQDRAILRDLRVFAAGATTVSVGMNWVGDSGLIILDEVTVAAAGKVIRWSDEFIVVEPEQQLWVYSTDAVLHMVASGHWFGGAGPSVP